MELIVIVFVSFFIWYALNKTSYKLSIKERVIKESFSFNIVTVKVINRLINDDVLGGYYLQSISEHCSNNLTYQGPICLDGTPDLRYNLNKYGYKLDQTLTSQLKFTSVDGNSKFEKEIISGKCSLRVSTYSKGINSSFLGKKDLDLTCLSFAKELNLFSFCLMRQDLRELIFTLVELEGINNNLNKECKIIKSNMKDLTNKINLLEHHKEQLTSEEYKSYEDLKCELLSFDEKLKFADEQSNENIKKINYIAKDISNWVTKNIDEVKDEIKNYKLRRKIANIISK